MTSKSEESNELEYDPTEAGDADESPSGGRLWKILLPVLVLLVAAGGTAALIASREAPPRVERKSLGPLVETLDVSTSDVPLTVSGHGEVSPRIKVELLPEVPGKVTWVNPSLRSGGRFAAGETLLRIDDRDYKLAVERAKAAVARAETGLQRERAEAEAATAEWRAMNGDETPPELLVRGPQIRQAEAELAAARADLSAAELNLDRTRLSLPFDGIVVSENVSPGQFLAQGRAVATVYGTEAVEVRVPLADSELAWFDVNEAPAEVRADVAGGAWTWRGSVERLEGQVDPRSRMVHVVVRVDRPFDPAAELDMNVSSGSFAGGSSSEGASSEDDSDLQPPPDIRARPPLLPGTFVDVAIDGRTLRDVVELPRYALREGGVVWAASPRSEADDGGPEDGGSEAGAEDGNTVLRLRRVEVVRADREHAYVRGLQPGDRVIVSSLDAPVDGMAVRLAGEALTTDELDVRGEPS